MSELQQFQKPQNVAFRDTLSKHMTFKIPTGPNQTKISCISCENDKGKTSVALLTFHFQLPVPQKTCL